MAKFRILASVPDWIRNPDEIKRRGFKSRPIAGQENWIHLVPTRKKYRYSPDELSERSVIYELPDYTPVSRGLDKFMNYGETADESGKLQPWDQKISDAIKAGSGVITKKEDGTLIIRSVFKGVVILRTRGAISANAESPQLITLLGEDEGKFNFREPVLALFREKYPKVLNPDFLPNIEMYFEYIGPENKIVISYAEADLVFIHAREKESQQMLPWNQLQQIAENSGLNLVSLVEKLNSAKGPKQIQKIIAEMEESGEWDSEGVVVRHPNEPWMTKIKGPKYLELHKMLTQFSYKTLVFVCEQKSKEIGKFIISEEDFENAMIENEFDYETLSNSKEWFNIYIQRKQKILEIIQLIQILIDEWKEEHHSRILQVGQLNTQLTKNFRKEFATSEDVLKLPSAMKGIAFVMFDNQVIGAVSDEGFERFVESFSESILFSKNDKEIS